MGKSNEYLTPDVKLPDDRELPSNILTEDVLLSIPEYFKMRIAHVPGRYWHMPEVALRAEIHDTLTYKTSFSTLRRVRIAFWAELDIAMTEKRRVVMSKVYDGVCASSYFQELIRQIPPLLPWILSRPTVWNLKLNELAELAEERLLEILSTSAIRKFTNAEGTDIEVVDAKLAKVQVDIFELVQNRLRGAVAQNINQKTLQVNMTGAEATKKAVEASNQALNSMESILEKLKEVQEKRLALNSASQPVEVINTAKLVRPDKIEG